jgi:hypothetical protein
MFRTLARCTIAAAACCIVTIALAVDYTAADEPGLNPNRDYVHQSFAEHIDPYNGNLRLHYVDGFAAGNAGFDLKIQRSYNVLNAGDTYSPFGRGWQIHFGRVRHRPGQSQCDFNSTPAQSLVLELPDGSVQTLFKSNGAGGSPTTDYLTTNMWKARCEGTGGLTVYSPDGTQYARRNRSWRTGEDWQG